jgi:hypothetical protein
MRKPLILVLSLGFGATLLPTLPRRCLPCPFLSRRIKRDSSKRRLQEPLSLWSIGATHIGLTIAPTATTVRTTAMAMATLTIAGQGLACGLASKIH